MIFAKCLRMLGTRGEAEDAAQDTFVRLWTHRDSLEDESKVVGWVYRTATRLCLDVLRSRRGVSYLEQTVDVRTPEARAAARELLAVLTEDLDSRSLEVIALHRLDGLLQDEIADVLGVSARTVRRILSNADARLCHLQLGLL